MKQSQKYMRSALNRSIEVFAGTCIAVMLVGFAVHNPDKPGLAALYVLPAAIVVAISAHSTWLVARYITLARRERKAEESNAIRHASNLP